MTTYTVTSDAELAGVLSTVSAGDTILLEAGSYEGMLIRGKYFDTPVTIASSDVNNPAVFTGRVRLQNVEGFTFENLALDAGGLLTDNGRLPGGSMPRFILDKAENITLNGIDFDGYIPDASEGLDPSDSSATRGHVVAGYGYDMGLRINASDSVTVTNSSFTDLHTALYIGDSTNVVLDEIVVEAVREGIQFYETQGLTISNSTFQDFKPWLSTDHPDFNSSVHDHPDMIQFWGLNSTIGLRDITIANNVFKTEDGGSTQTIFGHLNGASAGVTATNFVITDNIITNGHPHGITLGDVDGAIISDNVLLPNGTSKTSHWAPTISAPGGENLTITNNVMVSNRSWGLLESGAAELEAMGVTAENNTMLSNDIYSDTYWGNWSEDLLRVGNDGYEIKSFLDQSQDEGLGELSSIDGRSLTLSDNAWKAISLPLYVTDNTVLSFDMSTTGAAEIRGIGLATGNSLSELTLFQLDGTQTYGLQNYADSYDGGTVHYDIALGDFVAGDFDRIVFIGDDDAHLGGTTTFSNIDVSASEVLRMGSEDYQVQSFAPGAKDEGNALISSDANGATLSNNAWKFIEIPVTITADTVFSFDLTAAGTAEVRGIGFAKDDTIGAGEVFQLDGVQTFGIQTYAGGYSGGPVHYDLAVGEYLSGDYSRIVLIGDDDAGLGGTTTFENLELTAGAPDDPAVESTQILVGDTAYEIKDFASGAQDFGTFTATSDALGLSLKDNAWKYIDLPLTIDEETVLTFDFNALGASEILGIGFTNGDTFAAENIFQLDGSQTYGRQDYAGDYRGGVQHYEIDLGAALSGSYDRLVFIADDDAGLGGVATFENIDFL